MTRKRKRQHGREQPWIMRWLHQCCECTNRCRCLRGAPASQPLRDVDGYEGLIGNTPMVRLRSLSAATGCDILVKVSASPDHLHLFSRVGTYPNFLRGFCAGLQVALLFSTWYRTYSGTQDSSGAIEKPMGHFLCGGRRPESPLGWNRHTTVLYCSTQRRLCT